ncbi:DegV family protein [Oceanobacillus alkalisoli]|uniref:DegV family protein n=1 Tax=Oceanobacillus alkalisoli TaxID=2925113 RepID=UPI001F1198ED|nr:DegV family protein [Oceanobacillus alkalisoli]MCF3944636.1 DegV family protein [Oceanobacillus alkalisoli]
MRIQLMTDGGADIPQQLIEQLQVEIVPLYLNFSDGEYKTGTTLKLADFHQKVKELNEVPRSAAPSPNDFYEAYKKVPQDKPIIMLSLSKELSSTYQNAVAAKNMILEAEPERRIAVINTKTASGGIALLLHDLYGKIQAGDTFEQVVQHTKDRVGDTVTLFVLQTLDNLVRGGRISKVTGKIAKTLSIKLLMRGSEQGEIEVTERVRGEKRALKRFIQQIGEYTKSAENKSLFMTHCNSESRAIKLLNDIKDKYSFKETFLTDIGPIIATHGGDGAIVIAFFQDRNK